MNLLRFHFSEHDALVAGSNASLAESLQTTAAPSSQDRRAEHGFDNRADLVTLSPTPVTYRAMSVSPTAPEKSKRSSSDHSNSRESRNVKHEPGT